ncbi:DNA polymerase III alpha subunit [Streptosporangium album]|uniref:DNA-directed DNA polymerase n=1 Tax=Streptosporangium album TaxID=47479 RepID=A0A7W7S0H3_9ACTN|nr:DNA polymerase III alpha subunit [Streptosporangium album]
MIMSSEVLTDYIPIMRRDSDGVIITQFDYPTCETLGLLKMDFLGLRNLTILDDRLKAIKSTTGEDIDLLKLPLDDRKTYELLGRGDTLGVFQLDGGGMRSLLRLMKPDNFEDCSALIALYRPGPMGADSHTNYALRKTGMQEITPIHPEFEEPLAEILGTTYGLIIYQEQVMAIAQKVAGFSLGKAALLTSVKDDKDKSALYLNECRRMGIKVLPPDVNDSDFDFTPRGSDVRFGLSAIRNVGGNVVDGIISARKEKTRFADFKDFLWRVPMVVCNKRVIESLIKAGAFDSFTHERKGLVMVHEQAVDSIIGIKKNEAQGQDSLFGAIEGAEDQTFDVQIPPGEWDKTTLLAFEREMLGLYVSDHPLFGVEHILASGADCSIAALQGENRPDGQVVTVGGILSGVQRKVTKKGDTWVLTMLEDLEGAIEVMIAHPGTTEVHLQVHNGPKTTVVRLDDRLRVAPSPALMGDLKQLLGPACLGA